MKLISKALLIIGAIAFLLLFVWTINIIPKQIDFGDKCGESCAINGYDYAEVNFNSLPWNKLNGECLCVSKFAVSLESAQKENDK